ncbi:retrovirus-related pol polyprotein from transposon RE1 [Citrus sinensis]|uniref:Retrovirus-related pol polyprotein from transposon RE1 n=1 Tax=Citrus sinensis TaxID=2711 RepID=A0ACB8LZU0_CITSI|nr:retrovirus-related pol polyprotein from transposon RE1 [Citrus sinensis]
MEKTSIESSPVVIQSVQSDGVFNAGIILTKTNYDVWSQIMEIHLAEREKLSYIRSSTKAFEESSKEYEKWYSENQKVKRWLLISMSPEIMKRYLRIPTAYEIWDALSKAFYDGSDELQVFTLNQKAFSTKQNGQPLSKFYGELVEIFRELDHRDKVVMKDPEDVVIYRRKKGHTKEQCFEIIGYPDWWDTRKKNTKHGSKTAVAESTSATDLRKESSVQIATSVSPAYLINRTPSSSLGFQTPFQVLNDAIMSPNVPNLLPHVFGCVAFVHLPQQDKLSPRALRCVFVGYALHKKGYRCYHPPSRKIYITMYVVFHEDIMYYLSESEFQGEYNEEEIHTLTYLPPEESQSSIKIVNLQDTRKANGDDSQAEICEDTFGEHNNSDTTAIENESHEEIPNQSSAEDVPTTSPIRRIPPQRQNRGIPKPTYEPDFSSRVKYPMSHFVSNHRLSESNQSFVNQLSAVSIPNSVQEALKDPKWKAAVNDEMRSLQKNQTWELVDLPPGKKPVGCRWIYTIKYKADGSIERYKARLVAKGYTQTYRIDYTDTFAPVAKINTIRILLSLAVNLDWPVQQFDVKNAFLHGDLSEEIYMDLPPGCSGPERLNQKVCKLKKSLYGLKQSLRAWFGKFTKAMVRFGYNQSNSDHTLFIKKRQGKITALIVYVDDMVVTGNDEEETEALQKYLSREFEMKDLGALKCFLGIEVSRSKGGIFLSQRKYALDLLHETGMTDCQPIDTPIEEGLKFCITSDQVPVDKGRYQRLIGRLMYLSHTRPDLAYALSVIGPGQLVIDALLQDTLPLWEETLSHGEARNNMLLPVRALKQNIEAWPLGYVKGYG